MKQTMFTEQIRYGRAVDWDVEVKHPTEALSRTWWSITKTKEDNIKATFNKFGVLVKVELV